jgi:polyisoprenoid-binding protein YceI
MKKSILFTAIILMSINLLHASGEGKKTYMVNIADSKVNWIGSKPAGEHNGTVDLLQGTLILDNGKISGGRFTLDMKSIKNFDLQSPDWNKKLVDHLKSQDFFYVEKYPVATFEITNAEALNNSDYRITGVLTMKEVSKSISFKANITTEGNRLTASSEQIILDRTEWNVEALSKSLFAELKDNYVNDEIKISVNLKAEVQ